VSGKGVSTIARQVAATIRARLAGMAEHGASAEDLICELARILESESGQGRVTHAELKEISDQAFALAAAARE